MMTQHVTCEKERMLGEPSMLQRLAEIDLVVLDAAVASGVAGERCREAPGAAGGSSPAAAPRQSERGGTRGADAASAALARRGRGAARWCRPFWISPARAGSSPSS